MPLAYEQTFERFVPGAQSAEAFTAATAFARGQAGAPRFLLLCGPPGVGKTHLLRSISDFARRQQPSAAIVETSGLELIHKATAARDDDACSRQHSETDLIVADDLHVLAGKPVTQAEIVRLLMAVVDAGGHVACAIAGAPAHIPVLIDALRGRPSARVVEMRPQPPDEMRRILAMRAAADGLRLSARTLTALADQGRGDVRRGMGALTRLRFEMTLRASADLR